jgi:hypothetical protein
VAWGGSARQSLSQGCKGLKQAASLLGRRLQPKHRIAGYLPFITAHNMFYLA